MHDAMYNLQYIMRNLHDVMLAINAITHDVIGNLHTAMEFYDSHQTARIASPCNTEASQDGIRRINGHQ